ncbi:MAG: AAA family ATPase [Firmicutes bacterium]|nr:AAA family ATPase [Bacillota bacterium]
MTQRRVTDNLDLLLAVLPPRVAGAVEQLQDHETLIEIVLDLGRQPEARFPDRFVYLGEQPVSRQDIDYVVERVGDFGADNRAGIERTLHRISAIRNRQGQVVGLTCRIGRAVYGTIDIIQDVIESGKSILFLGRPGVGKTTMLREVARVLSDDFQRRVIVVDTSNEIAGDGDIPHPAIGHARRMQVAHTSRQADVMIEAVENHMPEVIIIDEIGTQAEAEAARTIAERGVQLIGTAHGNYLENLILNPVLSDLVGGIQAVTLGDEEARKRGTQKTVLERKAPPTFDVVVEIQERDVLAIHHDVAATVDAMLRGFPPHPEIRERLEDGEVRVRQKEFVGGPRREGLAFPANEDFSRAGRSGWAAAPAATAAERAGAGTAGPGQMARAHGEDQTGLPVDGRNRGRGNGHALLQPPGAERPVPDRPPVAAAPWAATGGDGNPPAAPDSVVWVFPYGVSRNRLERVVAELRVPVHVARDLDQADVILTLKGQYRKMPKRLREAERRRTPIYVIRSNTLAQIEGFVRELVEAPDVRESLAETERAIRRVQETHEPVDLTPARAYIRRLQHQMAEKFQLISFSEGQEPFRRVRIMPPPESLKQ